MRVSACLRHVLHVNHVLEHVDASLLGHGTIQLHVPGISMPHRANGELLEHLPGSKPACA